MILNNTKMLPPSIIIPKSIQITAKLIQFISPTLTVRLTDKLFRTPLKFAIPEREHTMWKSAQKKRIKIEALDNEIDVLSYGYSTKKVLLIHGWAGRSTQLFMIADKLLEKGYMIISFDANAHGKSEGEKSSLFDFIAIIKQLNRDFGPFDSAVGHSLGGMTLYNTSNHLNLKSIVTIGAADKISNVLKNFIENLSLKPKAAANLKQYYDKEFRTDMELMSSSIQALDVKIPALVIHDSQDSDVPVSCAQNIRQNLKKGSLLITQGLGHTKILRDKETMNQVVNFINKNQ